MRLYEVLLAGGPTTVSDLADKVGMHVGTVSYHLRVLSEHGQIEEAPELKQNWRERWWRAVPGGPWWSEAELDKIGGGPELMDQLNAVVLRRHFSRLMSYFALRHELEPAFDDAAYLNEGVLRLTAQETKQFSAQLQAVVDSWARRVLPGQASRGREAPERPPVERASKGAVPEPAPEPELRREIYFSLQVLPLLEERGGDLEP